MSVVVRLNGVVRSLDGRLLEDGIFDYVFRLDASRIVRLNIEPACSTRLSHRRPLLHGQGGRAAGHAVGTVRASRSG